MSKERNCIPTDSHGVGSCEVYKIKSALKFLKPH